MTFPVVDIGTYVTAALAWAVPLAAILFMAGWGVRLVFGRRRQSLPTIAECLILFSNLLTSEAFNNFLLILGWASAFVFVFAFVDWAIGLLTGSGS